MYDQPGAHDLEHAEAVHDEYFISYFASVNMRALCTINTDYMLIKFVALSLGYVDKVTKKGDE